MKKMATLGLSALVLLGLTACGGKAETVPAAAGTAAPEKASPTAAAAAPASSGPKVIQYGGKEYTVPAKSEKIVITGALESMEDALLLDVKPVGAITVGGKFPSLFASITDKAEGVGEKTQPNLETILKLKPDVILMSTKFPAETIEKMAKIGPTIPVSHISTDWENNLKLLGELTGKQDQANQVLQKYKSDAQALKEKIGPVLKDKKVLALRVRSGSLFIYPEDVFFNPSIYAELGAAVPAEVKQAKAQQNISLEKLSEMNPDYLFVQFSEEENKDTPKVFEELKNNPIFKSINAVKNGQLYTNLVDPLTQGGTAYSKIKFLEALGSSKLVQAK
ncbi:iron-hydroxamate ABC transporter substrate-binding protein [Paenibacillus planticolens]|uniref:ABC transporter substrate-binding protein n=1 Tax=Paenibacillus planticolens TaxID=2654976 RepID=A0ABX1ZPV9_9BACL|nr:iron-hydroxamate ABC transporter substrate-binding protein [Paenibacillus planticolens]NOV01688.1 ABC transporter substrate-binding protein [Paenibacillus planticolens]